MDRYFSNVAMLTDEMYHKYIEESNDLLIIREDIICRNAGDTDMRATILPEEQMLISMHFTGIVEKDRKNRIQQMQYEKFTRTMAEMMQKYSLES